LGWVSLGILISTSLATVRRYDKVEESVSVPTDFNKLFVRVNEPEIRYSGSLDWLDTDGEGFDITEDSLHYSNVKLNVEKSEDSFYHVVLLKYSRGRNKLEARQKAERIVYHVSSLDSNLNLGNGISIAKAQKFRGQQVLVEIKVPVGKRIHFDETVREKLHPLNVKMSDRRRWNRNRWNGDDWNMDWDEWNAFHWDSNVDYVMKENGELEKADALERTAPGVYEYKKNPTTDSLRKQIEEKEKQLQEERQRLKDLESTSSVIDKKKKAGLVRTAQLQWPMSAFII
jgi:hypothetical protein